MKAGFLILLFFFFANVFPQNYQENLKVEFAKKAISQIEIFNFQLIRLFDTILEDEKKCRYFTEFVSYKVVFDSIQNEFGTKHLVISAIGYENLERVLSQNDSVLGFYFHKNHYFFMQGKPSTCLLSYKQDAISFEFRNLPPDEDDRWTIYRFVLFDNRFVLFAKENNWLCN